MVYRKYSKKKKGKSEVRKLPAILPRPALKFDLFAVSKVQENVQFRQRQGYLAVNFVSMLDEHERFSNTGAPHLLVDMISANDAQYCDKGSASGGHFLYRALLKMAVANAPISQEGSTISLGMGAYT